MSGSQRSQILPQSIPNPRKENPIGVTKRISTPLRAVRNESLNVDLRLLVLYCLTNSTLGLVTMFTDERNFQIGTHEYFSTNFALWPPTYTRMAADLCTRTWHKDCLQRSLLCFCVCQGPCCGREGRVWNGAIHCWLFCRAWQRTWPQLFLRTNKKSRPQPTLSARWSSAHYSTDQRRQVHHSTFRRGKRLGQNQAL